MNTIPLVKGNTQEEINTSLIALKKALDEMNSSSSKTDASVQLKIKQINELITNINSQLDTIDGQITDLQPVDEVASGNMQSVTSNAVAKTLNVVSTPPFNSNYILWAREIYNPITKVVTIFARVKDGTSPILGQDLIFPTRKGNNNFYPVVDVKVIKWFEPNHRILLRGVNYVLQVDSISDVSTQIEISYIAE